MRDVFLTCEIKRILKSKVTQIILFMGVLSAGAGILFLPHTEESVRALIFGIGSSTALSQAVLYPVKAGTVFSVFAFTVLTLFELDKTVRFRVNNIIEPVSGPIKRNVCKIAGLVSAGGILTAAMIFVITPCFIIKMGGITGYGIFLCCSVLILFGAVIITVLMTSGFYLVFRSVNITCILMLLMILFSFSAGNLDYRLTWIQTGAAGLSSCFGSGSLVLGMIWNRLFGISAAGAVFLLGLLCDRCYEKGAAGSFFYHCRKKKLLPVCFLALLAASLWVYHEEPVFHSLSVIDLMSIMIEGKKETPVNSSVQGVSDMIVDLEIEKNEGYAAGTYTQEIVNHTDQAQRIYFNLADGYHISAISLDQKKTEFQSVSPKAMNSAKLSSVYAVSIPGSRKVKLTVRYAGTPREISVNKNFSAGIHRKYVSLTHAEDIAPVLCIDQNNRKIEGTVTIGNDFTIVMPGEKNRKIYEKSGLTAWSFSSDQPAELSLTGGEYGMFERETGGTDVEFFFPSDAENEFVSRGSDTLDIFSFFSDKFGPLGRKELKVIVTSGVAGGIGVQNGNVSSIAEDCLTKKTVEKMSQASSSDTFALLTHEIAHQWWGGGIDASDTDSENQTDQKHDEWTNEAFAEFSTYLFLKGKFGQEYADRLLLEKWKEGAADLKRSYYERNPGAMETLPVIPKYNVTLALRAEKLYGLGPLELYNIYHHIGEARYERAMKTIYKEYFNGNRKLTFSEFLSITGTTEEVAVNG